MNRMEMALITRVQSPPSKSQKSFSCGSHRLSLDAIRVPSSAFSFAFWLAFTAGIFFSPSLQRAAGPNSFLGSALFFDLLLDQIVWHLFQSLFIRRSKVRFAPTYFLSVKENTSLDYLIHIYFRKNSRSAHLFDGEPITIADIFATMSSDELKKGQKNSPFSS